MRQTRIKKFRNRHKLLVVMIKVLTIWYISVITATYLIADTGAYFNDVEKLEASVHVNWPVEEEEDPEDPGDGEWDKSSLDFDGMKRGGTCAPPYVFAEIRNDGEDMTTSIWRWELYKVGKGRENKTPTSPVLASGVVPKIKSGEIGRIEANAPLYGSGDYRFKVIKPVRPGQGVIWSEVITIKGCPELNSDKKDLKDDLEATTPKSESEAQQSSDETDDNGSSNHSEQPGQTEQTSSSSDDSSEIEPPPLGEEHAQIQEGGTDEENNENSQ